MPIIVCYCLPNSKTAAMKSNKNLVSKFYITLEIELEFQVVKNNFEYYLLLEECTLENKS